MGYILSCEFARQGGGAQEETTLKMQEGKQCKTIGRRSNTETWPWCSFGLSQMDLVWAYLPIAYPLFFLIRGLVWFSLEL